ncbi:divergent polysaccharide deacetylase family protein [Azospirillum thermophilum]|uniref:Divergent polysaccharide deacetylase family protein n=1 Tax=Azospirillum thermophilum TaxID=2202148 RepID=A0A2S2CKY3_9PROT|nr:divergent polysaccharide deacetylase family protein [Azospirillum thermophilum]AWK85089.1 divergent polysaccharide deacetylase family protein [Azospirillum thermophilum]
MPKKSPRKPRKAAARFPAIRFPAVQNPFLLAAIAVALVFALGFGLSRLGGSSGGDAPPKPVAGVPAPPAAKPAPPPAATAALPSPDEEEGAYPTTEPEPGSPAEEPAHAPAVPPPPVKPVVAMLPPPLPPSQAPSGTPAWRRNALPSKPATDKPAIAIVIDDMGVDRKRSTRMASLAGPLTLSWLPYAHDLQGQAKAARANGHELMLHLPMEPSVKADPGPGALLVSLDRGEIQRRVAAALGSFDGYVGVNNHMGSRFTADRSLMAPVLGELQRRGLLWLDSRTTPNSAGIALAREMRMPYAARDIFLDNDMTVPAVLAQLRKTEQVARSQGYAIAIGHPHDATIEALASWMPEVQKRGFVLVPVSAVVKAHHAGG